MMMNNVKFLRKDNTWLFLKALVSKLMAIMIETQARLTMKLQKIRRRKKLKINHRL
jgi:hypothetical protein